MQVLQDAYFERMGVSPRITMEMENMEAIKSLVSFGLGAALLPVCCVQGSHGKGVVPKRIHDLPMSRQLLVAVNDWKTQPRIRRNFIERIRQSLQRPEIVN
jgi:LysR family transcriptional activator of glutamate synthase operon